MDRKLDLVSGAPGANQWWAAAHAGTKLQTGALADPRSSASIVIPPSTRDLSQRVFQPTSLSFGTYTHCRSPITVVGTRRPHDSGELTFLTFYAGQPSSGASRNEPANDSYFQSTDMPVLSSTSSAVQAAPVDHRNPESYEMDESTLIASEEDALPRAPAPKRMLAGVARHTLGLILLLCVVFLWTLSSFLGSVCTGR